MKVRATEKVATRQNLAGALGAATRRIVELEAALTAAQRGVRDLHAEVHQGLRRRARLEDLFVAVVQVSATTSPREYVMIFESALKGRGQESLSEEELSLVGEGFATACRSRSGAVTGK